MGEDIHGGHAVTSNPPGGKLSWTRPERWARRRPVKVRAAAADFMLCLPCCGDIGCPPSCQARPQWTLPWPGCSINRMGTCHGLLNGQSDRLTDYPAVGLSIAHTPANARLARGSAGRRPGNDWSDLPGGMGVDVQRWHMVTAGLMVLADTVRRRDGLRKLYGSPGRARSADPVISRCRFRRTCRARTPGSCQETRPRACNGSHHTRRSARSGH